MKKSRIANCSVNKSTHTSFFTSQQRKWIEDISLASTLLLINASEFDDQFLDLSRNEWRFRFSGENKAILFSSGLHFHNCSQETIKLIKYLTVEYIKEHSASVADKFAVHVATTFNQLETVTRKNFVSQLLQLVSKSNRNHSDNNQFYYTLYALRKLESVKFFKSTDDRGDLEDVLLDVPRPRNSNWGRYQNIDLLIPDETCLMIENGVQTWASKLCPKFKKKSERIAHLKMVERTVEIDALRDCIILGIIYYVGARPVQINKMAGCDYVIDTECEHGMRFSLLVPYAKKTRITAERVRVAIPEELGKLIVLYKYLNNIGDQDQLFPSKNSSKKMVDHAIKKMLFEFSPKETQDAVLNHNYELPVYTANLFRHNVGHSMAMNGASAPEISNILGHSTYAVADKYISATPEISDIREHALGRNPVFKNMMALMLTGNLVYSGDWKGRRVAASIGGKLHHQIGGCNYEENICPFSQGRGCYGCLYFVPFINGDHRQVLGSFFDEIDEVRDIADDVGKVHHPILTELVRRKDHVIQVIARIEMIQTKGKAK